MNFETALISFTTMVSIGVAIYSARLLVQQSRQVADQGLASKLSGSEVAATPKLAMKQQAMDERFNYLPDKSNNVPAPQMALNIPESGQNIIPFANKAKEKTHDRRENRAIETLVEQYGSGH